MAPEVESDLKDLCAPRVLKDEGISPDRSASRYRGNTQPLARQVWGTGASGLRWWSSFWGDWHTTVLFTARTESRTEFGEPIPLTLGDGAVVRVADLLSIQIGA